jgi:hypothetical protein
VILRTPLKRDSVGIVRHRSAGRYQRLLRLVADMLERVLATPLDMAGGLCFRDYSDQSTSGNDGKPATPRG